jgi:hypothetical protein
LTTDPTSKTAWIARCPRSPNKDTDHLIDNLGSRVIIDGTSITSADTENHLYLSNLVSYSIDSLHERLQ